MLQTAVFIERQSFIFAGTKKTTEIFTGTVVVCN